MSRVSDLELQVAAEQKVVGLERYRELVATMAMASNWIDVSFAANDVQRERILQVKAEVNDRLNEARLILGGDR